MRIVDDHTLRNGERQVTLADASGGPERIVIGHGPNSPLQAQVHDSETGKFVGIHIDRDGALTIAKILAELAATLPERWTDGDVVRLHGGSKPEKVWTRHDGSWTGPGRPDAIADREIDAIVDRRYNAPRKAEVLRQQSGQDL